MKIWTLEKNTWIEEFVIEQKCIPWKAWIMFNKLKMVIGRGYDKNFFDSEHRRDLYETSVKPVVLSLIEKYKPESVVDLGCGDGIYLEEFNKRGLEVMGYDNSREGIKRCRKKGINIKRFNIVKNKLIPAKKYDLAICFEVAEHIPTHSSEKLVRLLSSISDLIIFTAAPPGQGGHNHINEQPNLYWVDKFNYFGYQLDKRDTESLKKMWFQRNVIDYMANNLMVFKKRC